jgi:hypothetical protein
MYKKEVENRALSKECINASENLYGKCVTLTEDVVLIEDAETAAPALELKTENKAKERRKGK